MTASSGTLSRTYSTNVEENKFLYLALMWLGVATLFLLISSTAYSMRTVPWSTQWFSFGRLVFNQNPTLIFLTLLYTGLSIKVVPADKRSGAYSYGRALISVSPGLHFIPFLFIQLRNETRLVQEFQCPGDPEKVFKGDDKVPLPPGMVRPIRAVTRAPTEDEKGVLDHQMTLTLNFVVQYEVFSVFDFIANFGTFENVEKQLRDIGETTLAEYVTQQTPAKFIRNLKQINRKLVVSVQRRFENSGIRILSVRNISPDLSHEVSTALAQTPIKKAQAEQTVIESLAEKERLTNVGDGEAASELAKLKARAEGQKKIKDDLGVDGETVVAAGIAETVNDKADVYVFGSGGAADAAKLAKAVQATLKTPSKGTPS